MRKELLVAIPVVAAAALLSALLVAPAVSAWHTPEDSDTIHPTYEGVKIYNADGDSATAHLQKWTTIDTNGDLVTENEPLQDRSVQIELRGGETFYIEVPAQFNDNSLAVKKAQLTYKDPETGAWVRTNIVPLQMHYYDANDTRVLQFRYFLDYPTQLDYPYTIDSTLVDVYSDETHRLNFKIFLNNGLYVQYSIFAEFNEPDLAIETEIQPANAGP